MKSLLTATEAHGGVDRWNQLKSGRNPRFRGITSTWNLAMHSAGSLCIHERGFHEALPRSGHRRPCAKWFPAPVVAQTDSPISQFAGVAAGVQILYQAERRVRGPSITCLSAAVALSPRRISDASTIMNMAVPPWIINGPDLADGELRYTFRKSAIGIKVATKRKVASTTRRTPSQSNDKEQQSRNDVPRPFSPQVGERWTSNCGHAEIPRRSERIEKKSQSDKDNAESDKGLLMTLFSMKPGELYGYRKSRSREPIYGFAVYQALRFLFVRVPS